MTAIHAGHSILTAKHGKMHIALRGKNIADDRIQALSILEAVSIMP